MWTSDFSRGYVDINAHYGADEHDMTRFAPSPWPWSRLCLRPRDGPRPAGRTMAVTVDDLPAMPSADLGEMRRITDGVLAARRRTGRPRSAS